jgi:hypothetical protein
MATSRLQPIQQSGSKQIQIKKVKIDYLKPSTYTPMYVTGVIGGATPKGDILINFYTDLSGIPESQLFNVNEGKLGEEIIDKRIPSIVKNGDTVTLYRQVQSGVIISINEAKELRLWLDTQISIVESQLQLEKVKRDAIIK